MDVILKKDVEHLGYKNDLVNVKPGYARNYLVPKGLAVIANSSTKKVREEDLRQRAHREAKLIEEAKAEAEVVRKDKILQAKEKFLQRIFSTKGEPNNKLTKNKEQVCVHSFVT